VATRRQDATTGPSGVRRFAGRAGAGVLAISLAGVLILAAPAAGHVGGGAADAAMAGVASKVGGPLPAGRYGVLAAGRPATRCTVDDRRLGQISGLAERADGFAVVNDTGPIIWRLDDTCRPIRRTVLVVPRPHDPAASPPGGKPFDTEDIATDASGAFWIGDIGGNTTYRTAVSLYRWMPGTATTAVTRYDLAYPDGAHDAEALLLGHDGRVVIVTKTRYIAGVYLAQAPLRPVSHLQLVGGFDVRKFCPSCHGGSVLVTGGAVSKDGTRLALRTYDRAFEWYAPSGDIVGAILHATPQQILLPPSRQGEAIAYTDDARTLLTATERVPAPIGAVPLRR
jgi:hypothetical protein